MAEASMKRGKSEEEKNGGEADRLSSLPDSLLCHIMSYLPTSTSIATMSLVSRRWSNLWKHLQVFDFEHIFENMEMFERFEYYVNSVLALRRSRDIRKFHLYFDSELSSVNILIYHIQINLPPPFLMNCPNLVSLSLHGDIKVQVKHSSVHFPSLKRLELGGHIVDSEVAFLSGCPKLETLDIDFYPEDIFLTKVPIPPSSSSKWLKSTNHNFTWTYFHAALRYMQLGIIGNFHSMVEAFLDVFSSCESEFVDPILYDLKDLYTNYEDLLNVQLCHSTSKQCPLQGPALNYPEFHKLYHLKFILPCFNSNLLVDVLQKCHILKVLIIQSNKEEPSPLRTWEPHSTTVPRCLKSCLTYIHIEGYQGCEDELTFAEYILRNGLVLETVLIFVDTSMDLTNKYRSVKRLLDIPRGSAKCQLKFDPVESS